MEIKVTFHSLYKFYNLNVWLEESVLVSPMLLIKDGF